MQSYEQDLQTLSDRLGEHFAQGANVKHVFGEPVSVGKKTIIPVARLGYGYGGGVGGADESEGDSKKSEKDTGGGGGFGGGLRARPAGVVEITEKRTRFIPYRDGRNLRTLLTLGLGVALGLALGRGLKP